MNYNQNDSKQKETTSSVPKSNRLHVVIFQVFFIWL